MRYRAIVKEGGRITAISSDTNLGPDAVLIDIAGDIDMEKLHDYRVSDGELVYDPLPELEPVPSELDKAKAEIAALKAENLMVMGALTDVYEMMLGGL